LALTSRPATTGSVPTLQSTYVGVGKSLASRLKNLSTSFALTHDALRAI
jgi:hypothetical protein